MPLMRPDGRQPAPKQRTASEWSGYFLIAPALIALTLLFFLPTISVFLIAMTDWQLGSRTASYVGLDNFIALAGDPTFRTSLNNTFVYVLIVVPGTIVLGLGTALLIEAGARGRRFYRAMHFLPYMATLSAMAIAWEALLHPTIGVVNGLMHSVGMTPRNWLRDSSTVLPVLATIGIWRNFGFAMVLFLAGLKAIPGELYEAADIDGADSWWERLRLITLPMLGPVTMFVSIVTALNAFETFDTIKILTLGGPSHSSEMLLYTLYVESFEYLRTGYGAAITIVFLAIVLLFTLLQKQVAEKRVHYV